MQQHKVLFNSKIYTGLGLFSVACSFIQADANPWKLRVFTIGMLFFYIAIILKRNSRPVKTFVGDVVFNYCIPVLFYGVLLTRAWIARFTLKQEAERVWQSLFSERIIS